MSEYPLTEKWKQRALDAEKRIAELLNELKELHLRTDRLESEILANPVRIWKQPDAPNAYSGRVDIEARLIKPKDKVE